MTTYEELTLIVNVALLIVAILTYTHKKESCFAIFNRKQILGV